MLTTSATDRALIHFALTYLNEHFDEELLERFRDTQITDELSEQLEGKETMDRLEWVIKCVEKLQGKVYQTGKTVQELEKTQIKTRCFPRL